MTKTVADVMTTNVFAVKRNESLAEVYQLMYEHNFRHVPVVDDDRAIVGIISERDLLRACIIDENMMVANMDKGAYLSDHPVSEIMSTEPETVGAEALLADGCQILLDNKFDCLPVVQGQRLVGIVTTADIIRELISREEQVS